MTIWSASSPVVTWRLGDIVSGDAATLSAINNEDGSWDALAQVVVKACCILRDDPSWASWIDTWKKATGKGEDDFIRSMMPGRIEKTLVDAFTADYSQWKGTAAGMRASYGELLGASSADILKQINAWEQKRVGWAEKIKSAVEASGGAFPTNLTKSVDLTKVPETSTASGVTSILGGLTTLVLVAGGLYIGVTLLGLIPKGRAA